MNSIFNNGGMIGTNLNFTNPNLYPLSSNKRNSGIWSLPSVMDYNTSYNSEEPYSGTLGAGPTSVAFVTSGTSTVSTSLAIPASAQAGDLAILFDAGISTNTASASNLTGWTLFRGAGGDVSTYQFIYYKKLTASDLNTTLTLRSVSNTSRKAILIFRPNADYSVTVLSSSSQNTANAPGTQTLTMASQSFPVIGFASYLTNGTSITSRTSSLTMTEVFVASNHYLKYISYNSSGSNGTVSQSDNGTNNLVSGSLRLDPPVNLKRSNIWDLSQVRNNLTSPKVEYIGYNFNNTVSSSFTYTNQPIGGPGLIAVAIHNEQGTISSVTIGGVTATQAVTTTSGVVAGASIYYAFISSGTTATIVLNFTATPNNPSRSAIAVYRITNVTSNTPVQTSNDSNTTLNLTSKTNTFTSVNSGDVVISAATLGATCGARWSGNYNRYDESPGNGTGVCGASMISPVFNPTIITNFAVSTQAVGMVSAAWR